MIWASLRKQLSRRRPRYCGALGDDSMENSPRNLSCVEVSLIAVCAMSPNVKAGATNARRNLRPSSHFSTQLEFFISVRERFLCLSLLSVSIQILMTFFLTQYPKSDSSSPVQVEASGPSQDSTYPENDNSRHQSRWIPDPHCVR